MKKTKFLYYICDSSGKTLRSSGLDYETVLTFLYSRNLLYLFINQESSYFPTTTDPKSFLLTTRNRCGLRSATTTLMCRLKARDGNCPLRNGGGKPVETRRSIPRTLNILLRKVVHAVGFVHVRGRRVRRETR